MNNHKISRGTRWPYAVLWRFVCMGLLGLCTPDVIAQTTSGNSANGQSLFTSKGCAVCHAAGTPTKANAINAGGHIAHANTQSMGGQADATGTQFNDIAAYFATLFTDLGTQNVSFGGTTGIGIPNIVLNTALGDYVGLRAVSNPSRGSVSFSGTTANYTPATGQCGSDSFTYEAYRTINSGTSNLRTVNLVIGNPALPNISTSAGSISGTQGSPISPFTPVSTGGTPSSYALTGALPAGLVFSSVDGSISGTPGAAGTFNVTLIARNCLNGVANAQSASKAIAITINAGGLPQAPLTVTATPNPVGSLQSAVLALSGGSGNGTVSFSSASGNCTINGATLTAQAASGSCLITALKAGDGIYQSASATVTVNLLASQTILFASLPTRSPSDPPFAVTATGGASGNPVTFSASGNCTASGSNGATITVTGAGTCTITANQAGSATYAAAPAVAQSFMVVGGLDEIFPTGCQVPQGWFVPAGAQAGWSVVFDQKAEGSCSLMSGPLTNSGFPQRAEIAYTGNFLAGTVSFAYQTKSEPGKGCLRFLIDGVVQSALGTCKSGYLLFSSTRFSVPITAGVHTVTWRYEKTESCCNAAYVDAAWIDDVRMPLPVPPVMIGPDTISGTFEEFPIIPLTILNGPVTLAVVSGALPNGLAVNGGFIEGGYYAAGTFVATLSATNAYGTATKTITFNIAKRSQNLVFERPNNRQPNAPPFQVSASAQTYRPEGYYGVNSGPILFSTSGVCTVAENTVTLTGAAGICSITASQPGNQNYLPAAPVTWDVTVTPASAERFPPACAMPAGWVVPSGATTGWSVVANEASTDGACSLKTNPLPDSTDVSAVIEYTGTFLAGNVSFTRRVSSERYDCLYFYIDGVGKNLNGTCDGFGIGPVSGEVPFISSPISHTLTAGTHTLRFEYRKNYIVGDLYSGGFDAAWIDELTLPLATLTINRGGTGTGNVISSPEGINCGTACSKAMNGRIVLTASANPGSAFTGWSGGGCSGTGTCALTLTANTTITATFALVSAPSAPQSVSATPGPLTISLAFAPPASNGGDAITQYTASCGAAGQQTRSASGATSPLLVNGLSGGVAYSCSVTATNTGGTGPASSPVTATPATLSFTGLSVSQTHAGAGTLKLDVDPTIPRAGAISIDPRVANGARVLRFRYDANVSSVSGVGVVGAFDLPVSNFAVLRTGTDIEVTLNDLADATRVTVTLPVINGANLNTTASVGFLAGDVTGSGAVGAADIAAIKSRIGAAVTQQTGNARFDLNGDGQISSADVSIAKSKSGRRLP